MSRFSTAIRSLFQDGAKSFLKRNKPSSIPLPIPDKCKNSRFSLRPIDLYALLELHGEVVRVTLPASEQYPINQFWAIVNVFNPEDGPGRLVTILAPDDDGEPLFFYADILMLENKAVVEILEGVDKNEG